MAGDLEPLELTLALREIEGVTVVELGGELDISNLSSLRDALASLDLDKGMILHLDLANLEFLDSSGMGVIVSACRRVRASNGSFSTSCGTGNVRRALEVAGLVQYLELDGTEPCA